MALVVGPTGLAYGPDHDVYVASTDENEIFAIAIARERTSAAGLGSVVFADQQRLRRCLKVS